MLNSQTDTVLLVNALLSAGVVGARYLIDGTPVARQLIGIAAGSAFLALMTVAGLNDIAEPFSYLLLAVTLIYNVLPLLNYARGKL